MKRILTGLLLILSLTFFGQIKEYSPKQVGLDNKVTDLLDNHCNNLIEQNKLCGAVVLMSKDAKIFHFKSYGWRDKEAKVQMTNNSIFNIASMTKAFVTVSILMLQDEGRLSIDEPVKKYIPEIGEMKVGVEYYDSLANQKKLKLVNADREITIRHLLSHTSGFMTGWLYTGLVADQYKEAAKNKYSNLKELVLAHTKIPLGHQPGTEWKYDFSTNVLGYLVEVLSNKTLEDFIKVKIFIPLKINSTGYQISKESISRVAQNYTLQNDQLKQLTWPGLTDTVTLFTGTTGMWSTAEDYFKLCQMILNKGEYNGIRILKSETVNKLFNTVEIGKDGDLLNLLRLPGYGFGLGFAIRVDNKKCNFLGSEGELCWFGIRNTAFWIDPKEKIIGIVLTHSPHNYYQFSKDIRNIVYSTVSKN